MFDRFLTMNVPTLAVWNGRAIAGGVFMGLCHDKIVMRDDPSIFAELNELNIGIPFCYGMSQIPIQTLNHSTARHLLMGNKLNSQDCFKEGVVRELFKDTAQLEKTIQEFAEERASQANSRPVMKASKTNINMKLHEALNGPQQTDMNHVIA